MINILSLSYAFSFSEWCLLMKKARAFQKNIYFCFIDYIKTFMWITTNYGKFFKRWEYQTT